MISLEIAISNFKSYNYQEEPINEVTLKFGEISAVLNLSAGEGGKCLYLNLAPEELQDIYLNYACGLFIMNRTGKYFSLLSFERLRIEDKIICNEISFFNDLREAKYHCQFSIVAKGFRSPRLADTTKLEGRQNALDLLKKPPIPKQTPQFQKVKEAKPIKQEINTFLYGNKPGSTATDNLQTLKEDLRKKSQVKSNLQKSKSRGSQLPQAALSKQPQPLDNDEPFQINPPMMQFTNQQTESPQALRVPQIAYMEYEDSIDRSKQARSQKEIQTPKQNNFLTFNKNQNSKKHSEQSPETPSEFQLGKRESSKGLPPKRPSYSKEDIKLLAKEEAESRQAKENVMIPIARGDKFQLLPLSALKPEEIIEYVQKQRRHEEEAAAFELRKRKLDERERELEEKNRKLQQLSQKRQSKQDQIVIVKRPSKQIRESVHQQIKEQDNDSQEKNEDDYMSDFQSVSASNSIIRSRISSKGNAKNISKEEESAQEDDYSNDFDSYSHSALSKTNAKNNALSISDYSESYRSISQSYRKEK